VQGRPTAVFLFCFNINIVNAGPQAARATWVNDQGISRLCGALLMLIFLPIFRPHLVLSDFDFLSCDIFVFQNELCRSLFFLLVIVLALCILSFETTC